MSQRKTITLCADDYGLNEAVSQGICQLVSLKRLSAVSCMVNLPHLEQHAKALLSLNSNVAIGLHLNLTEGSSLSAPSKPLFSLNQVLIKSHTSLIDTVFLKKEFHAQLDRFEDLFNRHPDFIDGHQHVHQCPVVRQVFIDLYQERLSTKQIKIRCTYPTIHAGHFRTKAWLLSLLGGKSFARLLQQLNLPHNPYFSGIYDFSLQQNYRYLFQQWIAQAPNNTLIMCHPGLENEKAGQDPIAKARWAEWSYFSSDDFIKDCKTHLRIVGMLTKMA